MQDAVMERIKTRVDLLRRLPSYSVGAELGVLDGEFSSQIVKVVDPRILYLVDLFTGGNRLMRKDSEGEFRRVAPSSIQAWNRVRTRFRGELACGKVQLICAESCAWLSTLPCSTLDWVYLDDDHTYEHVLEELTLSQTCVKPGGWVLGHDYCDVLPGVVRAVNEFCQQQGLSIDLLTDEDPAPVYPRPPGLPEMSCYNSYAIRLPAG